MNKDVKKFVRQLKANGLRVEQGRNSHFKIYCEERLVCTISASPSDHRWLRNCEQTLAKSGFGKFIK
jgi:hypothetical protein